MFPAFEFFYEIFTEDASPLFLYHDAKKSKMTKNSNQGGGGSCHINHTGNYYLLSFFLQPRILLRHMHYETHVHVQDLLCSLCK